MRRSIGNAADQAFNPVLRDCLTTGCLPEHVFTGGNTWAGELLQNPDWRLNASADGVYLDETKIQARAMLQMAASIGVELTYSDTVKIATVRVTNQSGHKLPTGYPEGRQMWIHLQAFDVQERLVYESGAYDPDIGQLIRDADIKVYETKQGITPELSAVVKKPEGETFHFVLNNMVVKDNRIPPRGYTVTLFDRPGLRPVGASYIDGQHWDDTDYTLPLETVRVVTTLYYQTSSKEYIDFLRTNGGADGHSLGELWGVSKSPPELMAQATLSETLIRFPFIPNN
jgi:hypothetical protein